MPDPDGIQCRPETVTVDGQDVTVSVRGAKAMDDTDRAALAEVVAAVQRRSHADPRQRAIGVLMQHQRNGRQCECGHPARIPQQHAAHVVRELTTAGLTLEVTSG